MVSVHVSVLDCSLEAPSTDSYSDNQCDTQITTTEKSYTITETTVSRTELTPYPTDESDDDVATGSVTINRQRLDSFIVVFVVYFISNVIIGFD